MPAVIDSIFSQSVEALLASGHRRTFKVLSGAAAGRCFDGTLSTAPVIDPELLLGSDLREQVFLEVLKGSPVIDLLKSQDLVQEGEVRWKLVKREDNPVDVEAKYSLMKVTKQDQG